MNRGLLFIAICLTSLQAQAHVSQASGVQHASEHFWLLLALMPVVMLLPSLIRRFIRSDRR